MTKSAPRNKGAPPPVEAFKQHGADFVVRDNLRDLVAAMNKLAGNDLLDHDRSWRRSRRATARSTIPTQGCAGHRHPWRGAISATG
jgi:predicted oxidoreductase